MIIEWHRLIDLPAGYFKETVMPLISFYDLFVKIIKLQYATQMSELHHYYLQNKHLLYDDLENLAIEHHQLHFTILNLLMGITNTAAHPDVKIYYKDFRHEDVGQPIACAQFWEESRLFYQGGGTTLKLPGDPTLFFSDNILDIIYANAPHTLFNHASHTNSFMKRLETVKDHLLRLYGEIPVLTPQQLMCHAREACADIPEDEVYIVADIFKKDDDREDHQVQLASSL